MPDQYTLDFLGPGCTRSKPQGMGNGSPLPTRTRVFGCAST